MAKKIELKIVATGRKLNADDRLLVLISPRWAEYMDDVLNDLQRITGHRHHAVIPVPPEDMKVFSVQHPIIVSAPTPKREEQ